MKRFELRTSYLQQTILPVIIAEYASAELSRQFRIGTSTYQVLRLLTQVSPSNILVAFAAIIAGSHRINKGA